jgi:hypothetical protein
VSLGKEKLSLTKIPIDYSCKSNFLKKILVSKGLEIPYKFHELKIGIKLSVSEK